jgi:hypothetical protein
VIRDVRTVSLRLLIFLSLSSFALINWNGCAPMTPHDSTSRLDSLAGRLSSCSVSDMSTGLAMDPKVNDLWREFPEGELYANLVEDARRPDAVRFGAALVLRSKDAERFRKTEPHALAQVFATALKKNLAGYAYPWGWLWAPGDPVGLLGQVFLEIGRPALPALEALLDDSTPRDIYMGSEEATEMAMRRYRVKDFAAFYIAQILKLDLPWEPDLAKRDEAIAKLRAQLPPARHPS